jgi:hypothetical protein
MTSGGGVLLRLRHILENGRENKNNFMFNICVCVCVCDYVWGFVMCGFVYV